MAALSIDVQLGGNLGILQREEIDDGVFYMDWIVLSLHQECGRSLIGGMNVGIRRVVLVRKGKKAGIDDDRKIGTTAELVGGVQWIVKSLVEVSTQGSGKVGAGGEAQHSNAVWINVPLGCVRAHDAEGALSILLAAPKIWDMGPARAHGT